MSQPPFNRRRFFREGLRRLMDRVADSVQQVEHAITTASQVAAALEPTGASDPPPSTADPTQLRLRPPGAARESEFLAKCQSCGDCVRVCPVQCIRLDAGGKAFIEPGERGCILCDGLVCMPACPTGALKPVPLAQIRMGTAVWRQETCIRTKGEECRACVEHCPLGSAAIDIDLSGRAIVVNPKTCAGCGKCQEVCPTDPKSIVVIPVASRT